MLFKKNINADFLNLNAYAYGWLGINGTFGTNRRYHATGIN